MSRTLAIALLIGIGSATVCAEDAAAPYEVETIRDTAYYDGPDADSTRHKLDLYLPKGKKEFAVVFFVHGGGWMLGDKNLFGLHAGFGRFLASQGVGAVLPNYRLSPAVKHPEHVKDVARAFAWTHRNIGKYGGRSDRIVVAGHSAGGHLVTLLATDGSYLKAEGLTLDAIRGVVGLSGVYHIPDRDSDLVTQVTKGAVRPGPAGIDLGTRPGMLALLSPYTPVFGADVKVRQQASPLTHVREGLPPFLLFTADSDFPTLPEMAAEFAQALEKNKCDVTLTRVKDRSHNTLFFKATTNDDPVAHDILAFVQKHTKPQPGTP